MDATGFARDASGGDLPTIDESEATAHGGFAASTEGWCAVGEPTRTEAAAAAAAAAMAETKSAGIRLLGESATRCGGAIIKRGKGAS